MIIKSVVLEDFRSYFGRQEFILASDKIKNTTFIWAANNVGKTNLLNAITWCFHEIFTSSFKKVKDLLNHEAEKNGTKTYSVTVVFEENGKEYSVKRIGGLGSAFHVHVIQDDGEYKSITSPLTFINTVLPKDMMKYFVIDGEGDAVAVDSTGQIAVESSIRDILGTQVADRALVNLKGIRKNTARELENLSVGSELSKKQKEYSSIDGRLDLLKDQLIQLKNSLASYKKDYEIVDSFLSSSNHEVVKVKKQQESNLKKQLQINQDRLKELNNKKIYLIRKYSWVSFSDTLTSEALDFIDENEFKGTIPAPFNETLVKDILEEKSCICGAEIKPGTDAYTRIYSLLKKAANPDLLNRIGRARSQLQVIKSHSENAKEDIKSNYSEIENTLDNIKSLKDDLEQISLAIENVDVEKISNAESDRRRLDKSISSTNKQIWTKESDFKSTEASREKLSAEIHRLSTFEPRAKIIGRKLKFIDGVIAVIENELVSAMESVKILLISKMNEFMKKHLRQHHKVAMSSGFKIGLYDTNNNLVAPGGGYTAILSLVYISTLISIAKQRSTAKGNILTPGAIAPLILDAPFSRLDPDYAPSLAAALPESVDQLVIIMFEGNARGGDLSIRNSGKLGKEYYLTQHISEPIGDKKESQILINGRNYNITEYDSEVNKVMINEVVGND